ncbi:hypothetical protein [Paraburkholderia sp. J63]|uniref:hypothetical protein n=1 Tax=Paraburkholderia sp. J63 TaxID=2805434 RepID=UPI002ABD66EB|nr:hypothetical protein [Paraburkholderia sp. J63]
MADETSEDIWSEYDDKEQETRATRFEQLKQRCQAANIAAEEVAGFFDEGPALVIKMPCGRALRSVQIDTSDEAQRLLDVPFEKYRFVPGFDAVFAPAEGIVEASVRSLGSSTNQAGVGLAVLPKLFGPRDPSSKLRGHVRSWTLKSDDVQTETELTLRTQSDVLQALLVRNVRLVLFVQRPGIDTAEKAESMLVKLSDALFFQIEHLINVALGLVRERLAAPKISKSGRVDLGNIVQFPTMEYDKAPISLYWYGRNAGGMPLLQFLAYYQVLEYFYPVYSKAEANRRVRRLLKEPGFRVDKDSDVNKLLGVIQAARGGAFLDERSQLKATLGECLDQAELRDYLNGTPERIAWFKKKEIEKENLLKARPIPLADERADLVAEVAERIYAIRCKIVHTKAESAGDVELLLPYSKEADALDHDIDLVRYACQKVLISASVPIHL